MAARVRLGIVCALAACVDGRPTAHARRVPARAIGLPIRQPLRRRAAPTADAAADGARAAAKDALLAAIRRFDAAKAATATDGVPVDFGVRGGELDAATGRPLNLLDKMRALSPPLADAAAAVLGAVDALAPLSPTADPTRFFGTAEGARCPLHGAWALQFTTAADASFSANSTRGAARTRQFVDGVSGRIVNQIDFVSPRAPLAQLRVLIDARATSPARVRLAFRWGVAHARRLFGLPIAGRVYLPLFALFALARRVQAVLRTLRPARFAAAARAGDDGAFFEIVYVDAELRVHRTGEGNVFVQLRPEAAVARGMA